MTIVGPDYAYVDGNPRPDTAAFKSALAQSGSRLGVVALRAAWGNAPDPTLARDWNAWKDAGATMLGYLFLRIHAGAPDPEAQVDIATKVIGALTDKDLPLCIDVEDTGQTPAKELELVHRAWTHARGIYGVPPLLYTSARVWHEDLNDLPAGEMTDSPLWLAKPWFVQGGKIWYARGPAELSGAPFAGGKFTPSVPAPWGASNWWMHQYQGDANPVPGVGQCDLSRFNVMRLGERGERVKWVQRRLGMIDLGVFDAQMASRIAGFQQQRGLDVDSIIGPQTFAAICWCGGVEKSVAA